MNGTTELDLWNLLQISNMANGIQFLGIAFLAWVGMRISSSIYNSGDSNMVVKIAGTVHNNVIVPQGTAFLIPRPLMTAIPVTIIN